MATDTLRQIENISKSLRWIKKHRPEHYERQFLDLVDKRRALRCIADAEREKPAIAAFGESQKGKSYLISNLLQKQKTPFNVQDENGEWINFVKRVNPIGDNKEATGVVTRFTPLNTEEGAKRYNAQHPVIVKLFSLGNIATILCDSYYNDLMDSRSYADDEIKEIAQSIYDKYSVMPEQGQTILTEDDILDIRAYISKYVKNAHDLLRSNFFEKLALVVRRIPQNEWESVLQTLWHGNPHISGLFRRLLSAMNKLGFAREIYVNFDAVMHLGNNKNTIMSVDCLNGLDDKSWALTTDVYINEGGNLRLVSQFPKCELCALCAETIFKVHPDYMMDEESFFFDPNHGDTEAGYMPQRSAAKLPPSVKKDLLADIDLLDFPGARSRLKCQEEFLTNVDENGTSNLVQMLLRGKVAFLFNHYSDSRLINILLFCHDSANVNVNEMYTMINDWVNEYVGKDTAARERTVRSCGGVSPLFVIGTKFNMDMIEKGEEDGDNENALNQRWYGRFIKILYTQSFKAESVEWFNNWTSTGTTFKNTYLLRDFKYSGCDGSGNNLYEGYSPTDPNPAEKNLLLTTGFYNRLRDTFIAHPDVRKFFEDPALSWDVAASMNNDGALYIISQMAIVAKNMITTRANQFADKVNDIRRYVADMMREYYVSDDTTEILNENIRKANGIFREMEFACQNNPEFFGRILDNLQLSESMSFEEVHKIIPDLTGIVHDSSEIQDYQMIRQRCDDFKGCKGEEDYWNRIIKVYHFTNREEAEQYLRNRKIDISKLFKGEEVKRKNSAVITRKLLKRWEEKMADMQLTSTLSDEHSIDSIALSNLINCLVSTAKYIGLSDIIEQEIAGSTDILDASKINQNLTADLISTAISDFVLNFGYNRLSEEQLTTCRRVSAEHNLPCFDWISRERRETYDEDAITELCNDILNSDKQFTPAYEAHYNNWLEYMYLAHIAHLNVPEYDVEANDELKTIIENINN